MTIYADLGDIGEDQRIEMIGKAVMGPALSSQHKPPMAAFVVETNEKADRYVGKLQKKFPGIRIIDRLQNCPCAGMVSVRIGGPLV